MLKVASESFKPVQCFLGHQYSQQLQNVKSISTVLNNRLESIAYKYNGLENTAKNLSHIRPLSTGTDKDGGNNVEEEEEEHKTDTVTVTTDMHQKVVPVPVIVPLVPPPPGVPLEAPDPALCCGTGCANCVWIQYTDALIAQCSDGGVSAREAINNIEDPVIRMFVKIEVEQKIAKMDDS